MPHHRALVVAAALLTLPALSGCLVTSSNASSYSGNRVDPAAESGVVLHRTTVDQAISQLGTPSSRSTNDQGEEVLTWRWTRRAASSGRVFLILGRSSQTTEDHALHITFREGVAVRRWRD